MKSFTYTVTSPQGLHARPCVSIIALVKKYESIVTIACRGKQVIVSDPIQLMTLTVKPDDILEITVDGPDETEVSEQLLQVLKQEV